MPKKKADIEDVLSVITDLSNMISARFDQVEHRLDIHDERFDTQDRKIDQIYNILDAHLKRIEEILQENTMRDHQQARME